MKTVLAFIDSEIDFIPFLFTLDFRILMMKEACIVRKVCKYYEC